MTQYVPVFNSRASAHYIEDPKVVSFISGILSGLIGFSFMLVFDTVGDTILYCFATEQRRHSQVDFSRKWGLTGAAHSGGLFSYLFGSSSSTNSEDSDNEGEKVNYAPPRLRELIEQHQ